MVTTQETTKKHFPKIPGLKQEPFACTSARSGAPWSVRSNSFQFNITVFHGSLVNNQDSLSAVFTSPTSAAQYGRTSADQCRQMWYISKAQQIECCNKSEHKLTLNKNQTTVAHKRCCLHISSHSLRLETSINFQPMHKPITYFPIILL